MAYVPSILLTLALVTMTIPTRILSESPNMAQCSSSLMLLAPCMPFVQGVGPIPTDQCCNGLASLVRDQPGCICSVLGNAGSLPVNRSLVLQLPSLCQVNIAGTVNTNCAGIAAPLPPSESPKASKPTNPAASEPPPVQSAPMPLQRTKDQLLGQNKGEKMKLRNSLVSFCILVSVLAVAL